MFKNTIYKHFTLSNGCRLNGLCRPDNKLSRLKKPGQNVVYNQIAVFRIRHNHAITFYHLSMTRVISCLYGFAPLAEQTVRKNKKKQHPLFGENFFKMQFYIFTSWSFLLCSFLIYFLEYAGREGYAYGVFSHFCFLVRFCLLIFNNCC